MSTPIKNWRAPVLALLALAVAVGLLADRPRAAPVSDANGRMAAASVASADASSDVWFCAAGTAVDGGAADHRIVAVNTTDRDRAVTITAMASRDGTNPARPPVSKMVPLGPFARTEVRLADVIGQSPYAAATVEVNGGGVLVEHSVSSGPIGFDRVPCATATAEHWYVPLSITGTEKNASVRALLVLYNPFRDDAVVDVSFSAEPANPPPLDALVVSARSVQVIDLNAAAPVSAQAAAAVIARSGSVVVERIEILDDGKRHDLVLTPGVAAPAATWVYPSGRLAANRQERLVLYNTGTERVTATIEVRPDDRSIVVEPFDVAIPARRHVVVDLSGEARLSEAKVQGYALVVRAPTPVLATERLVTIPPGQPGAGAASTTGAALAARQVFLEGGAAAPNDPSEFVVFNPNRRAIAQVSLEVIVDQARQPAKAGATFDLQPGERRVIPFASLGAGLFTVVINATAPVMAERESGSNNVRSAAMGVPARAQTAVVDVIGLNLGS